MRTVASCSELECLILGLVALGATSGYAMRKSMTQMHGNRWSVESGSIYRALRRLAADKLVREEGRAGIPNRQRVEYTLTDEGREVLHRWLARRPDTSEVAMISDPIRTRSYFLTLLDPDIQLQTVQLWIAENKKLMESLNVETRAPEDMRDMSAFALISLRLQARARHEWLKKIQDHLKAVLAERASLK